MCNLEISSRGRERIGGKMSRKEAAEKKLVRGGVWGEERGGEGGARWGYGGGGRGG